MAAIAAKAVAKKRAAGNGKVPFVAPELPWRKEVDESLVKPGAAQHKSIYCLSLCMI